MVRLVATADSDVSVTDLCLMTVFLRLSWFEVWQCPHMIQSNSCCNLALLYCAIRRVLSARILSQRCKNLKFRAKLKKKSTLIMHSLESVHIFGINIKETEQRRHSLWL